MEEAVQAEAQAIIDRLEKGLDRFIKSPAGGTDADLNLYTDNIKAFLTAKAKAEEEKAAITESVERDMRAWLLVEAIAKKEKIFCLEDDVDAALAEIAARHGAKPSAVREYYEQQGLIAEVRSEVVERKVCEFLRDQARIAEDEPGDGAAEEAGTEDA